MLWTTVLVATTALHAGFQATVTLLVYPALARVDDAGWAAAHDAHSRGITPLVVLVYGAVLVACAGAGLTDDRDPWVWVAVTGTAAAFAVTATAAAPTHSRLAGGRDQHLVERLLRADRLRLAGAVLALAGALLAAVSR